MSEQLEAQRYAAAFCPRYHHAVELLGRRWNGAILRELLAGATRFFEIRNAVPNLSDRLLSDRLKQLEAEGLIERRVIPDTPVRVEYGVTPMGRDLDEVVAGISRWANRWLPPEPDGKAARE